MNKLKMQSPDGIASNVEKIARLFPNCVTEHLDKAGKPELAIDFEKLQAELSNDMIAEGEERYQFTWPNKRAANRLANTPTTMTLRPCREESVDFDHTRNLYIEGDNLEVLKVLRETYLGKVKMIYIDPPYNTGNDFVYNDDFAQGKDEFEQRSGLFDNEGNQTIDRMQRNTESNGRFHTDWLNMMYPRLKVAKELLSEDGVIFISIGDEEVGSLRIICDEIFGSNNFRNQIIIRRGAKSVQAQFETWDKLGKDFEYILLYTKSSTYRFPRQIKELTEIRSGTWNNHWRGTDRPTMRYPLLGIEPISGQWRWSKERSYAAVANYERMVRELGTETISDIQIESWLKKQNEQVDLLKLSDTGKPVHYIPASDTTLLSSSWMDLLVGASSEINSLFDNKVFDTAKLTSSIIRMMGFTGTDALVLDFFSGSATTAHAVMQLNARDGGNRRFIMVQLPELCDEKSEAYKAGYKNICEIGKERIRRAGKKIKEESGLAGKNLDIGFRVLKLDTSNMEDVYYTPKDFNSQTLFNENVKPDRSNEDLLFQVMLDLGVELSAKIEARQIAGKTVHFVDDHYLVACFDSDVNDSVIKEIAKLHPVYFVMRDSSAASDNVIDNFEQIFRHYSPDTTCRII